MLAEPNREKKPVTVPLQPVTIEGIEIEWAPSFDSEIGHDERPSGLLVPKERPPKPKRFYGPLEIQDEELRQKAIEAMGELWDAMELSQGRGGIRFVGKSGPEAYEAHYQAYEYLGKMLLGRDCPEKEVLC